MEMKRLLNFFCQGGCSVGGPSGPSINFFWQNKLLLNGCHKLFAADRRWKIRVEKCRWVDMHLLGGGWMGGCLLGG